MATDDTRKAVSGWKSMKSGKKMSRRERIAKERQEESQNKSKLKNQKLEAIREAQEYAESQPEDPIKHLKKGYKAIRQRESSKKKMKLNSKFALLKLVEISENGGIICDVQEAGFDTYLITFMDE